ncbi:MAG: hypothetical protein M1827_006379 [Pycnora praestabilis]|nr:MAG: hypothetical protein M1827_006379 [Pycnora praestabilis]
MSFDEAHKLGQQHYRNQNYEAALEAFNEAVARSHVTSVSLLDNRAATFEKLQDFPCALRDGKRMIHLEKSGTKGYLRTGKILQLMGKQEVALGIYRYGLRNVSTDDPNYKVCEFWPCFRKGLIMSNYQLLHGMFNKLSTLVEPSKTIDPLLILPLELAEVVFKQLDFNNVVSKGSLTHARFNRLAVADTDIIKYAARCKGLIHLEVRNGFSGQSIIDAAPLAASLTTLYLAETSEVTLDAVTVLLRECRKLVRADFGSLFSSGAVATWPKDMFQLRRLRLVGGKTQRLGSVALNLPDLFAKAPNLQELCLNNWKRHSGFTRAPFHDLSNLHLLDLDKFQMIVFPKLPPHLHSLNLSCNYELNLTCDPSRDNLLKLNLESLVALRFDDINNADGSALYTLLHSTTANLKKLAFNCSGSTDHSLVEALTNLGKLDHVIDLELRDSDITDHQLQVLAKRIHHLKRLDISNTQITGVGVKALVTNQKGKIECLVLNNCQGISEDAVTWARSMGVMVQYSFPDRLKGKNLLKDELDPETARLLTPDMRNIIINPYGTIDTAKAEIHFFDRRPEKKCQLVMTGSAASYFDTPPLYLYTSAKAGILGLTRSFRTVIAESGNVTGKMVAPLMKKTSLPPNFVL